MLLDLLRLNRAVGEALSGKLSGKLTQRRATKLVKGLKRKTYKDADTGITFIKAKKTQR